MWTFKLREDGDWNYAHFDRWLNAFRDGLDMAKMEGESSFYVGELIVPQINPTCFDKVLETAYEYYKEELGERAADKWYNEKVLGSNVERLGNKLQGAFYDWLEEEDLEPENYVVRDIEKYSKSLASCDECDLHHEKTVVKEEDNYDFIVCTGCGASWSVTTARKE